MLSQFSKMLLYCTGLYPATFCICGGFNVPKIPQEQLHSQGAWNESPIGGTITYQPIPPCLAHFFCHIHYTGVPYGSLLQWRTGINWCMRILATYSILPSSNVHYATEHTEMELKMACTPNLKHGLLLCVPSCSCWIHCWNSHRPETLHPIQILGSEVYLWAFFRGFSNLWKEGQTLSLFI